MDVQPASYAVSAPTAISIGAAANTLVFIGVGAVDTMVFPPYVDGTTGTGWVGPLQGIASGAGVGLANFFAASLQDTYCPFYWTTPMLVKRISISIATGTGGGTSNAYARIYAVGVDGRPGRLLYDFGLLGTANASLASGNSILVSAAGNGYMLLPGVYYLDLIASYVGGTTTPALYGLTNTLLVPPVLSADQVINALWGMPNYSRAMATGGTAGAAPDPANLTGFSGGVYPSDARSPGFCFKAS